MKPTGIFITCVTACTLILSSCDPFGHKKRRVDPVPEPPAEVEGWAPIYSKDSSFTQIRSADPRSIEKEGKIYVKGDTLYQIEAGKGIHVIDIKQPANPQKIAFINITGAQEIAIKDNILYANNLNDLVAVDITNVRSVKEVDRISSVFHIIDQNAPSGTGYYECPVASKGTVVGWEQKTLKYPKCSK